MRKVAGLLFLMASLVAFARHAPAADYSILSAAARIQSGNPAQKARAAQDLESWATDTKQPAELRREASELLAFLSNRELKQNKRHFYAATALALAADSGVKPSDKLEASLLRISGDGYFEEGKLIVARAQYERLSHLVDAEEQDYAALKLGWIDINQGKSEQAFDRWMDRIHGRAREASQQTLRTPLLKDMGRAWAEGAARASDPQSFAAKVAKEKLSSSEKQALLEGLAVGMKRIKGERSAEAFERSLENTEFRRQILVRALSGGALFGPIPCALPGWLKPSLAVLEEDPAERSVQAAQILSRCHKEIEAGTSKLINKDELVQAIHALPFAPAAIEEREKIHRMRAQLFTDLKLPDDACSDYLIALEDRMTEDKPQFMADSTMALLHQSCATNSHFEEWKKLVRLATQKKLDGQPQAMALLSKLEASIQGNVMRSRDWLTLALADGELYRGTEAGRIAETALAALSPQDKASMGAEVLRLWVPSPLASSPRWQALGTRLVDESLLAHQAASRFAQARQILTQWLPLEAPQSTALRTRLWSRYLLALPDAELPGHARELQALLSQAVAATGGKAAPLDLVTLALKSGQTALVWSLGATTLASLPKELKKILEERSFDQWVAGTLNENALPVLPHTRCIRERIMLERKGRAWASPARKGVEDLIQDQLIGAAEACESTDPAFVRDLQIVIDKGIIPVPAAGGKALSWNASLPTRIERSVKQLDGLRHWALSHAFESEWLTRLSREAVAVRVDRFLGQVRGFKIPQSVGPEVAQTLKQAFQNVESLLAGWARELRPAELAEVVKP